MSIVWEFWRESAQTSVSTGVIAHFYNEEAQTLWLDAGRGMSTSITKVDDGHWRDAAWSADIAIGGYPYDNLEFDHPHNGTLYGAAADGDDLYFLRYVYAKDLSGMFAGGDWQIQIDNQIETLSLEVMNVSPAVFAAESSLFHPGAKITLAIALGDSDAYPVGTAYLDDISYSAYSDTVPVSGRNAIGYYLQAQTFDDTSTFNGNRAQVSAAILGVAGLMSSQYIIQPDSSKAVKLSFEPDTTLLDGLNKTLTELEWRMIEIDDGTIIIGDETFLAYYRANSRYVFDGGSEAFRRETNKNADAAYTRVAVKNNAKQVVYTVVPHWQEWHLGAHKTKYYDAPEGTSVAKMQEMATAYAGQLQHVGVGESFSGPIRPQLLAGDIAEVFYSGDIESTSLGLITDITHHFGADGFTTDFSIDSGGVATDADNYTVVSKVAVLDGYNRRQRVLDLVGLVAEKKIVRSSNAGGTDPVQYSANAEAVGITPASIMRAF